MQRHLKVIALISGGKDSIFSILQCLANEHEVVALANLHPPVKDGAAQEDLDSYMYQTIGHSIVPFYEEALGIPLYRGAITGSAIDTSKTYQGMLDPEDETENLAILLKRIQSAHPEANAICSGAILSSYQRTRLETVAVRLKLVPLAFLWQYPMLPTRGDTLLEDMAAIGIDARLVKTASGGLDESHLWLNIASANGISKLRRDMCRFGQPDLGALLGEGGEYETITVDGPAPLWNKSIQVEYEAIVSSQGTSFARCKDVRLKDKRTLSLRLPHAPALLDPYMDKLLSELRARQVQPADWKAGKRVVTEDRTHTAHSVTRCSLLSCNTMSVSNLTSIESSNTSDQLQAIAVALASELETMALGFDDIVQTTIILRRISDFAILNTCYDRMFSRPNPPSRVTFAVQDCLPHGVNVVLSAVISRLGRRQRQGLHVQSQSYWAPANIGPYSQAISHPLSTRNGNVVKWSRLVHVSGQIPLVPASMELCKGDFAEQAVLALQHLIRIGIATDVHCWAGAVGLITAEDSQEAHEKARITIKAWTNANEVHKRMDHDEETSHEDEDFDVGNADLRRPWMGMPSVSNRGGIRHEVPQIPNMGRIQVSPGCDTKVSVPCIVAQVAELPREATIEWVSDGLSLGIDAEGTPARAMIGGDTQTLSLSDPLSGMHFGCVVARPDAPNVNLRAHMEKLMRTDGLLQLEAYVTSNTSEQDVTWAQRAGARVIPCKALWCSLGVAYTALRWWTAFVERNEC